MSHLLPASYFIKVCQNQKELKTFKIIKKIRGFGYEKTIYTFSSRIHNN